VDEHGKFTDHQGTPAMGGAKKGKSAKATETAKNKSAGNQWGEVGGGGTNKNWLYFLSLQSRCRPGQRK